MPIRRSRVSPARSVTRSLRAQPRRAIALGDLCPRTPSASPSRSTARTSSSSNFIGPDHRPPVTPASPSPRRMKLPPPRRSGPLSSPPIRKRPRLDDLADEEPSSSESHSASSDAAASPPPDYAVDADEEEGHLSHTPPPPPRPPPTTISTAAPQQRLPRLAKPRSFLDALNKHVEPLSSRARKFSQLTIAQISAGDPYRSYPTSPENSSVQCVTPERDSPRDASDGASRAYRTPSRSPSPLDASRERSCDVSSSEGALHRNSTPRRADSTEPSEVVYVPHSPPAADTPPRRRRRSTSASSSSVSHDIRNLSHSPSRRRSFQRITQRTPAIDKRRLRRVAPPSPPSLALGQVVSNSSHTRSSSASTRSAPRYAHRPLSRHSLLAGAFSRRPVSPPRKMRLLEVGTQTGVHQPVINVNSYASIRRRHFRNHDERRDEHRRRTPLSTSQVEVINLCDEPNQRFPSSEVLLDDDVEVVNLCSDSEDERIREAAQVLTARRGRIANQPPLRRH